MRLLAKTIETAAEFEGLTYPADSKKICVLLYQKQYGFCAYIERIFSTIDGKDVEHFWPEIKNTSSDNYWNWYLVDDWINSHRPRKITSQKNNYCPVVHPIDPSIPDRIIYVEELEGEMVYCLPKDPTDKEIENLIAFLGVDKPEIAMDRKKHIDFLRDLRETCGSDELFIESLFRHPTIKLSYFTAIEQIFGVQLFQRIQEEFKAGKL